MDPFARSVDIWTALGAGVFSFISPCILPIIPSYMFFISGTSAGALQAEEMEINEKKRQQRQIIFSSLFFILGFSLVFVALGATATSLGGLLKTHQDLLRKIGGIVIIVLGLHMMGVIQIKALLYEKRMHLKARPPGYFGAFLVGLSFALGWTPCIGPILGAILAIASTKNSVGEGIGLLAMYSLGLAIPFFVTALMMDQIFVHFRKLQKHMQKISIASGVFLILIGILIFTNFLQTLSNMLQGALILPLA
ncbi:cytochrome C biogenesis protein [bacterium (Candidatus Blackallbacteria) CG17_big_fil_post_rev_8_21_14_2_50_48_46]|uniref:Cytochrome C biogenesis protein n=1 Tax=bacterium (Candidatus Blackallbacteria) CG17_big_fil_post_rev_8_21_14_2_50_48_46 TaxID=2014261 RepID=A0A2M7G1U4_9BACT|nr:MAG: cytochrome C biogenesis protein [bacterium (Candidatus Blackallbacteria) CG18_big_fil_WC_8_21_14_2_50_49_26]PIW15722.1 MAG: cytochrome C biogenesis protein [bacterium (Candidatus Blackallbacteria) CG17_big_fil_post_rev_8_21_14_2_50_48_46]PIW49224.1 MAG: cytochrome C biogenesis protein [bacterium (Candidatus Blackallbacteria) CG13_big_fil_rev_8_21_14_2_50_49_14]